MPRENAVINELIREYLEFNGYHHTLSVFLPESGHPEEQPTALGGARLGCVGRVSPISCRAAWDGGARPWYGLVYGRACCDLGCVGLAWHDLARPGPAWPNPTRLGLTWAALASPCLAQPDMVWPVPGDLSREGRAGWSEKRARPPLGFGPPSGDPRVDFRAPKRVHP